MQRPDHHLAGSGCAACAGRPLITASDFIKKSNEVHENKYDYSLAEYVNARTHVVIVCPEHGSFWQIPYSHVRGRGCPACIIPSHGERTISKWLTEHGYEYVSQMRWDDLRSPETNRKLPVDFWIPSLHVMIEYDGQQHFNHRPWKGIGSVEDGYSRWVRTMLHDAWKDAYADTNGYRMVRIPYTENILTILESEIS